MTEKTTYDMIVESADQLFYRQGYENTSFSKIADSVGISRGNFYYHFKSKDDILRAVIDSRFDDTRQMLARWTVEAANPVERIRKFIGMLVANEAKIMEYGCPVGTLCVELAKLGHPDQKRANELFTLFRAWLTSQFEQLGFQQDSDEKAMHLLVRSQGIATMANVSHDKSVMDREIKQLYNWLTAQAAQAESVAHRAS